ncbi:hypothetical protein DL1_02965 [Thioclava dalianensis]|uniref:DUF4177 domain-containing protein n=1 Tax=Thioclava dalianensis TaxID=1185766 RepID=A0A074TD00_9RHOB|nr:DUF4177 domain-containing protein [Thioclava dalianensis]KEP69579.1 hypothetical protein DL1_02965 [Thioclava dalianensis]SFN14876.1 protein of unknown function [Thioclava dalianensis]
MQNFEYKVIPAPARGEKERGLKTGIDRFANTLSSVMNEMAAQGWEYQRAETLPAEERSGLTGKTTVYHNLLVFRRLRGGDPARALDTHVSVSDAPANAEAAPRLSATTDSSASSGARDSQLKTDSPEGRAPSLRASRNAED